jgi:hypothetical protein
MSALPTPSGDPPPSRDRHGIAQRTAIRFSLYLTDSEPGPCLGIPPVDLRQQGMRITGLIRSQRMAPDFIPHVEEVVMISVFITGVDSR